MNQSRENLLRTALNLFSRHGYEAVSVGMIADALGLSKGAMYRHFKSKRDLFDQILRRMEERDASAARAFQLPENELRVCPEAYAAASVEALLGFSEAQFTYWTTDPFAAPFRKMLTLEQYRSPEMNALYQSYLGAGPIQYTRDLLAGLSVAQPELEALRLYGPMFFLFTLFDSDPASANELARAHFSAARARLMHSKEE